MRNAIQALVFAAAGLIAAAAIPLARDAVAGPAAVAIAAGSFLALACTRVDTVWVVLASATAGLLCSIIR